MNFTPKAHIIIIDGKENTKKDVLCFELALTLLYNAQKTAIVLPPDSPLREIIKKRKLLLPQLLTPEIINKEEFYQTANKYSAVIVPDISVADDITVTASTYITLLTKDKRALNNFSKKTDYLNTLFELKKKIASTYGRGLNWVICENNLTKVIADTPSAKLTDISKHYGFRVAPPLNQRKSYQNDMTGISAQDKNLPFLKKDLTYEDICAQREIIRLAEFIFS